MNIYILSSNFMYGGVSVPPCYNVLATHVKIPLVYLYKILKYISCEYNYILNTHHWTIGEKGDLYYLNLEDNELSKKQVDHIQKSIEYLYKLIQVENFEWATDKLYIWISNHVTVSYCGDVNNPYVYNVITVNRNQKYKHSYRLIE